MNRQRIILAGGTGFLGESLIDYFSRNPAYQVEVLSRRPARTEGEVCYHIWDGEHLGQWTQALEGAWVVVNLAGRTVNCRYHEKNKDQILQSRLLSTKILGEAIRQCKNPPKVWINAASATIYRHATDRPMDEITGEIGKGFSVEVCKAWEKAFFDFQLPHTRPIALRIAMVLGKKGGVMIPFERLVRFGMGGKQGLGTQYVSWIHEDDFYETIRFCIENEGISGAYNCASPNPMPNREFMRTLRGILKPWIALGQTEWMVKFGAWLISTEAELLLKSRRVAPTKLLEAGFQFKYPVLESAMREIITRK
jgi:hypothetical protein